jgi:hypothetical protein
MSPTQQELDEQNRKNTERGKQDPQAPYGRDGKGNPNPKPSENPKPRER